MKLTTELEKRFMIKISSETVTEVIRSHGFNNIVTRRKFFINERTRKLDLNFTTPMVD